MFFLKYNLKIIYLQKYGYINLEIEALKVSMGKLREATEKAKAKLMDEVMFFFICHKKSTKYDLMKTLDIPYTTASRLTKELVKKNLLTEELGEKTRTGLRKKLYAPTRSGLFWFLRDNLNATTKLTEISGIYPEISLLAPYANEFYKILERTSAEEYEKSCFWELFGCIEEIRETSGKDRKFELWDEFFYNELLNLCRGLSLADKRRIFLTLSPAIIKYLKMRGQDSSEIISYVKRSVDEFVKDKKTVTAFLRALRSWARKGPT